MGEHPHPPYTIRLRQLMQQRQIASFKALREAAQISEGVLQQLRRGQVGQIRLDALIRLSQALEVSLNDLIQQFDQGPQAERAPASPPDPNRSANLAAAASPAAYDSLQTQLQQQAAQLRQQFQQDSLATIETWLLQWPTAAAAAQANPALPAVRLLPLLKPLEDLLASWDVQPIGTVGATCPYDPHLHQLMDGSAQPGASVRVRYGGYRQGDRILHRAKVSPAPPADQP